MANAHLEGKTTVSGEQRTPCPPVARDRAEPLAITGQSQAPGTQVRIRDRYDVLLLRAALTAVLGSDFPNLAPVFALKPRYAKPQRRAPLWRECFSVKRL